MDLRKSEGILRGEILEGGLFNSTECEIDTTVCYYLYVSKVSTSTVYYIPSSATESWSLRRTHSNPINYITRHCTTLEIS